MGSTALLLIFTNGIFHFYGPARVSAEEGSPVTEIPDCSHQMSKLSRPLNVKDVSLNVVSNCSFTLAWIWTLSNSSQRGESSNNSVSFLVHRVTILDPTTNRTLMCRAYVLNMSVAVFSSISTGKVLYSYECCGYAAGSYEVAMHSLFGPPRYDGEVTSFTSKLIAARDKGQPNLMAVYQPACSRQNDVFISSSLPHSCRSVVVALGDDFDEYLYYETADDTRNPVVFHNVTPRTYRLFAARSGEGEGCCCYNGDEDDTCYDCGSYLNKARYHVPILLDPDDWSSTVSLNISQHHPGDASNCVNITFSPASTLYGFPGYGVTVRDAKSAVIDNRVISDVLREISIHSQICGIQGNEIYIEVTPIGACESYSRSVVKHILFRATASLPSTEPSDADTVAVAVVVSLVVCLVSVALIVMLVLAKCRSRLPPILQGKPHHKPVTGPGSRSLSDYVQEIEGLRVLFGGVTPDVLLLYAYDTSVHAEVVSTFATILETFGGCRVTFDKRCDPDAVLMNDWLRKQMFLAHKVVVVGSEGARMLHQAYIANQYYRRYSQKYPTYHHISEALNLSNNYPSLRQKMYFATFTYSPESCLSALGDLTERPRYRLPDDTCALVGTLHGAVEPYVWSCQQHFESSSDIQQLKRLIRKMTDKVNRKPNYFSYSYGTPEDRFDSGIERSVAFEPHELSACQNSSANTDVFTVYYSGYSSTTSPQSQVESNGLMNSGRHQRESKLCLPTDMPGTDEIWNSYIRPEPSTAGSLSSEQLIMALQRLNSEQSEFLDQEDSRSNVSGASCITIDATTPPPLPELQVSGYCG